VDGGDAFSSAEHQAGWKRRIGALWPPPGCRQTVLAASNNSFQADTALAFFPGARFTAFLLRP
jgi:hypothetical protein